LFVSIKMRGKVVKRPKGGPAAPSFSSGNEQRKESKSNVVVAAKVEGGYALRIGPGELRKDRCFKRIQTGP